MELRGLLGDGAGKLCFLGTRVVSGSAVVEANVDVCSETGVSSPLLRAVQERRMNNSLLCCIKMLEACASIARAAWSLVFGLRPNLGAARPGISVTRC